MINNLNVLPGTDEALVKILSSDIKQFHHKKNQDDFENSLYPEKSIVLSLLIDEDVLDDLNPEAAYYKNQIEYALGTKFRRARIE